MKKSVPLDKIKKQVKIISPKPQHEKEEATSGRRLYGVYVKAS